jgi:hypothetical protein
MHTGRNIKFRSVDVDWDTIIGGVPPANTNEITRAFTEVIARYFRLEFTNVEREIFVRFRRLDLLETVIGDTNIETTASGVKIETLQTAFKFQSKCIIEFENFILKPSQPYNLNGVYIVDQPPIYYNNSAAHLFNNYDNQYFQSSWLMQNVASPYVAINLDKPIQAGSIIFYYVFPNTATTDRWPRKFEVFSGTSDTGPWTLRGTADWSATYPLTPNVSQTVLFPHTTNSRFWRIVVSGHGNSILQVSEAVSMSPP